MADTTEFKDVPDNVPGVQVGAFKKAQLLGSCMSELTKVDPTERMKEIHKVANKSMHDVHKAQKHRSLAYAKCYVSTEGIYIFEAEKKETQPVLKWSKTAKDIYCVVMGKRTLLTHNNMACLMMFNMKPGEKPRLPCPMECVVFEFRHDHKNRAAQFHKACENMMKNLLSAEMSKMSVSDINAENLPTDDENVDGAVTEQSNYFEVPEPINHTNDDDAKSADGRDDDDDSYEVHDSVGKKARGSICESEENGSDYLTVIVAERIDTKGVQRNLSDMLAEDSDEDEL